MKNLVKISVILIMVISIFSCSKEDEDIQEPIATLNSISPESGKKGTVVTINGTNFGTNQNTVSVFFNDKPAFIQSVIDTEITATVPQGALTGFIKIIVDNIELTGPEFTYVFTVNVSTLAGGTKGFEDGVGKAARFYSPGGITIDSFGNIFVTDSGNKRIRKITPEGTVSTIAGNGLQGANDGEGINATFYGSETLAIDKFNNIYMTTPVVGSIRKISVSTGEVFTVISGLENPRGIVVDDSENIYVGDSHKLLKIDPNGTISTLAGGDDAGFTNGIGTNAKFEGLTSLTIDAFGIIYATDRLNYRIRRITPNGEASTVAGSTKGFADGTAINALFTRPSGITVDPKGNLFVADPDTGRIRKITPDGQVSTLAGSFSYDGPIIDGDATVALFNFPVSTAINADGDLYIADTFGHAIRKISFE